MKYFFIFSLSFSSIFMVPKTTETENPPFVLFQLFTSQGCSSCPPADYLLEQIKEKSNKNTIVMSYHVDYWNRLGWKDPFSKKKYTQLQYEYARQFKSRNTYTPQIVVNGKEHFVGSNKNKLKKALKTYLATPSENTIAITKTQKEGNAILFKYTITGNINSKSIHIALVLENKITKVKKGENHNKTISNSNIVIQQVSLPIDAVKNGNDRIYVPEKFKNEKNLRLIAFIQNEDLQITGAVQKKL